MKYFIDTEFIEGPQKEPFPLSIFRKYTKPTIDLISIGIVCEDGREYYEVCKDFNLNEAWTRFQMDDTVTKKIYWLRDYVILPIFKELMVRDGREVNSVTHLTEFWFYDTEELIQKYGKTKSEIAKEIRNFVMAGKYDSGEQVILGDFFPNDNTNPEFYAYFADYDWVAFCWIFGNMLKLPAGFPYYCKDLKQDLDKYVMDNKARIDKNGGRSLPFKEALEFIKAGKNYPKQGNEHNALEDARWNKDLFTFLN